MKGEAAMEFSGTQTIAAPIETVWAFLLDVNKVAACAPGFQSLEVLGEEHWKAIVAVGIGPVKAKFIGGKRQGVQWNWLVRCNSQLWRRARRAWTGRRP